MFTPRYLKLLFNCGVQNNFLSPFPHSGDVKILEVGQGGTNIPLSSPDCLL